MVDEIEVNVQRMTDTILNGRKNYFHGLWETFDAIVCELSEQKQEIKELKYRITTLESKE